MGGRDGRPWRTARTVVWTAARRAMASLVGGAEVGSYGGGVGPPAAYALLVSWDAVRVFPVKLLARGQKSHTAAPLAVEQLPSPPLCSRIFHVDGAPALLVACHVDEAQKPAGSGVGGKRGAGGKSVGLFVFALPSLSCIAGVDARAALGPYLGHVGGPRNGAARGSPMVVGSALGHVAMLTGDGELAMLGLGRGTPRLAQVRRGCGRGSTPGSTHAGRGAGAAGTGARHATPITNVVWERGKGRRALLRLCRVQGWVTLIVSCRRQFRQSS
eukprot:354090-Chlamydomonas_euryale.AAC.2